MLTSNRHGEKYYRLMRDPDPKLRVYAYRWDRETRKRVTPAVYKGALHEGLFDYLRDKHDGGEFNLMVRRGEVMELSERVLIAPSPLKQPRAFETYKATYDW